MMTNTAPTKTELSAGLKVIMAVATTIREAGEVPSGTIYATLMDRVSLKGYQKVLGILEEQGLISVDRSHLIRWTGPKA
jgi:hypothetical protein